MIIYESGLFGLRNLGRVHGSAVYKVIVPALLSTGTLLIYDYASPNPPEDQKLTENPYTIGACIAFISFFLVSPPSCSCSCSFSCSWCFNLRSFRSQVSYLNFSYNRYWESCTAVHQMLSKWLDCATCIAAFHYQSNQFDDIKPPAFGSHPNLQSSQIKGRERAYKATLEETMHTIQEAADEQAALEAQLKQPWWKGLRRRNKNEVTKSTDSGEIAKKISSTRPHDSIDDGRKIPIPQRFQEQFSLKEKHGKRKRILVKQKQASRHITKTRESKVPVPSLFLQETVHLVSLMAAVAMSTLRNDSESTESPLTEYIPGQHWPPADPDSLSLDIREKYGEDNTFWRWIYFFLGLSRSERHRTLYNAARPFAVLGGVSDREIQLLQKARGPYAKLSLTTHWLQEFICREYLSGSTGNVSPAILSRLYQFISDGVVGYNQARKVAYVPFPFPHAQITAIFSLAIIFIFPLLYFAYVHSLVFACVLNFCTVLCFLGVHEVARELENPFQNVPNDIPLTTFQAQFNEALVTFYAGFHPDAWWEITAEVADVSGVAVE
jgi:hypothetical protein